MLLVLHLIIVILLVGHAHLSSHAKTLRSVLLESGMDATHWLLLELLAILVSHILLGVLPVGLHLVHGMLGVPELVGSLVLLVRFNLTFLQQLRWRLGFSPSQTH